MAFLRGYLLFFVALFFIFSGPASADYAATQHATSWACGGYNYSSADYACAYQSGINCGVGQTCTGTFTQTGMTTGYCTNVKSQGTYLGPSTDTYTCAGTGVQYYCPNGGTLSGTNCVHTCPVGQIEQSDGSCASPCPVFDGTDKPELTTQPSTCTCPVGTKWYYGGGCRKTCAAGSEAGVMANAGFDINIAKGQIEGCYGGCGVQHKAGVYYIFKDGSTSAPAAYTGWACSGNGVGTAPTGNGQPQPDNQQTKEADKKPPLCGAGEGVITSSSGNVLCLPAGTPNTSTPKVASKKAEETYPDGSKKVTTSTDTTDPYTGATDTRTTTTSTGGMAGPAGTTTSTGTKSSNSTGSGAAAGEGGDCDPSKTACGGPGKFGENGNLYEKKYPNGLDGLLTAKYNDLKSKPVFGLVSQLAPSNLPNSGQCPTWSFSSNIGPKMPFGGGQFAPPCWVFDAIKIILLVTALLTARRLIFGG